MKRLNLLFSLSSLSVILITIERFSFTTKILLAPYEFLRLHELIQMTILILITVLIPTFLLREVSKNFESLKSKKGWSLTLMFIIGMYFIATGNGVHEISSFNFNTFCDTKNFSGNLCGSMFFNDYYFGNILYFIGALLMNSSLLFLEKMRSYVKFSRNDIAITLVNSFIYAFAIFAYAAFDRVIIGLIYSLMMTTIALSLFLSIKRRYLYYPVITYTTTTYVLGFTASLVAIFIR